MEKILAGDTASESLDVRADNIEKLKALFPELITENASGAAINVDVLKQLVGDATLTDAEEKYGLNWHGKRRARQLALTPSAGTLRPSPEDSVDWDATKNLMIEGDNLEVLKLLQKSYAGKVKMIYIDPPYNTGKDFVYPDNFQDSIKNYKELTGQAASGRPITSNTEASGRFHTDWLNMMYPRLKLARNLLKDDGLIFVSCNDAEASNLSALLFEVFGEENLVAELIWKKAYGGGAKSKHVVVLHEYIACFAKSKDTLERLELPPDPKARRYYKMRDDKFELRGPYRLQPLATTSNDKRENLRYPIPYNGEEIWPEWQWQWEKQRVLAALKNDELVISRQDDEWSVNYKQYLFDEDGKERGAKPYSILDGPYTQTGTSEISELLGSPKVFSFPKPTGLLTHLIQYLHPTSDAIVMDFFAGSGTTGHAAMILNALDGGSRRYILVQLPQQLDPSVLEQRAAIDFCETLGKPRNIAELTKERLRRAGRKLKESQPDGHGDTGFRVYKLDQSNIRAWQPTSDLAKDLLDNLDHIAPERTEQDVLTELLLKLGLDLCVPFEQRLIADKTVHAIGDGVLMACLDARITRDDAEPLALGIAEWHAALAPTGETTCVFRDSAFADDVAKTNLAAILEQHGIGQVRSL
jgi:adenine-specific DNA-methyltransferase